MATSPTAMGRTSLTVGGVSLRAKMIRKTLVHPAQPTAAENEWLPLSNLDRVVTPTFSSVIHFYDGAVSEARSFECVVGGLKKSLSEALVYFFPLAGRLELRDDGLVDLHCNDAGAVFIEMSLGVELAEVGGAQTMDSLSGLESARLGRGPLYMPDQLMDMPTLVVQVTRFKCGAVAVATSWHHTIADGSSGCHFIQAWSEIATGAGISLIPNHNRQLLAPRDPPNPSLVQGYSTKSAHNLNKVSSDREVLKTFGGSQEPPVINMFHLDKDTVQELKNAANEELGEENVRKFTSAEGISALLWQSMTRARTESSTHDDDDYPRQNQEVTRFFMFVDGRKKLNMPKGYFGNVVCSACAVSTEDEIMNNAPSYAATLIRQACSRADGDYFKSLIDWVEVQGSSPSKSEHVNSVGHDVAATFWTFFPLYSMEFGFGKPTFAARNSPPRPLIDGIAMMPSAKGPGNMVALLNLSADRMQRLRSDPQFNSVFLGL
ncbi:hypothetical protein MPTK1_5g23180 [Marchantia polymorpha subsp. ruderalis]|nr:hypothetical protein MARPO_0010s0138 [Marchantia polymorpha]BBN12820.1 hypothetical protein Mp_5g23180 [Marchantia polymorpha subsp. ruderalis]|eukprot:PTQ46756.1 hypothetical protein MARPO_0010s0138 [Marchantia polymorpha]